MTLVLAPAATTLERLEQSIERLQARHGFERVADAGTFSPPGNAILLLTDDPQRCMEALDACVIVPEALKAVAASDASCWVADHAQSAVLMKRFAVSRAPAVVFLRDGIAAGTLTGIRSWKEYQSELAKLLSREPSAHSAATRATIAVHLVPAGESA